MRPAGLGLDIVEIDRIRRLARKNPRFLKRVFSDEEIRLVMRENALALSQRRPA